MATGQYNVTDLDRQLADLKKRYEGTQDAAQRAALTAQATTLRSSGANEAAANWLTYGKTTGAGTGGQYLTPDASRQMMDMGYQVGASTGQPAMYQQDMETTNRLKLQGLDAGGAPLAGGATLAAGGVPTVDTSGLKSAIDQYGRYQYTKPTADTAQTFTWQQLQDALNAQKTAGGELPQPDQAKLGTPEQFGGYVAEMNKMLQPYLETQKQQASTAYNSAMQQLRNRLASRGLQASGTAIAQQRAGAAQLGQTMANIEGQGLQQAIQTALQAGQLSLQEANQIWNQAMGKAGFEQNRAAGYASGVGNALGNQENLRLNEKQLNFGVQQAQAAADQNYIGNLQNALGIDIGQGQWKAETDFAQGANVRDYTENVRQFNVSSGQNAAQLEEQKRQFNANMDQAIAELNSKTAIELAKAAGGGKGTGGYGGMTVAELNDSLNVLRQSYTAALSKVAGGAAEIDKYTTFDADSGMPIISDDAPPNVKEAGKFALEIQAEMSDVMTYLRQARTGSKEKPDTSGYGGLTR